MTLCRVGRCACAIALLALSASPFARSATVASITRLSMLPVIDGVPDVRRYSWSVTVWLRRSNWCRASSFHLGIAIYGKEILQCNIEQIMISNIDNETRYHDC